MQGNAGIQVVKKTCFSPQSSKLQVKKGNSSAVCVWSKHHHHLCCLFIAFSFSWELTSALKHHSYPMLHLDYPKSVKKTVKLGPAAGLLPLYLLCKTHPGWLRDPIPRASDGHCENQTQALSKVGAVGKCSIPSSKSKTVLGTEGYYLRSISKFLPITVSLWPICWIKPKRREVNYTE